jgi:uncharacterized protein (TIGR03083 family)
MRRLMTAAPPRRPMLDRATAMRLARTEYDRALDALTALSDADWQRPTDCPGWDVRAMASHLLGMAAMVASPREGLRQFRSAQRAGGVFIDELTRLQVEERRDLSGAEIVAAFRAVSSRAARARRMTPGLIRSRRMPVLQEIDGVPEVWLIGFLNDVILTRDPWMHRADIARATGTPMVLTPEHDGVLVEDVVNEWAERHQERYALTLTGPAGGTWRRGTGGDDITMDAVEFCRALSGRAPQPGLLRFSVPF